MDFEDILCASGQHLPILEPDLNHPHVEPCVLGELFAHMTGRFRTVVIGGFQGLQLFGGDCGAWPFIGLISIEGTIQIQTCNEIAIMRPWFAFLVPYSFSTCTFRFGLVVVTLTDQLTIGHEVEFVARVQCAGADGAEKTLQMIDVVLGATHHLSRRYTHVTSGTLRSVAPM